jgi:hypothetical protein
MTRVWYSLVKMMSSKLQYHISVPHIRLTGQRKTWINGSTRLLDMFCSVQNQRWRYYHLRRNIVLFQQSARTKRTPIPWKSPTIAWHMLNTHKMMLIVTWHPHEFLFDGLNRTLQGMEFPRAEDLVVVVVQTVITHFTGKSACSKYELMVWESM